jgi:hypothetical protein
MNSEGTPEFARSSQFKTPVDQLLSVHVLSEHVFCTRAGVIASESGADTGDEERELGPRLDPYIDYDEHKFVEALRQASGEICLWLTLLAPATFVVFISILFDAPFVAFLMSLPVLILLGKIGEGLMTVIALIRERAKFRSAPVIELDLAPTKVVHTNWWSLRKAGFDCDKLKDRLELPDGTLTGNPWRILTKGNTINVPVIRRQRGRSEWFPQHEIRLIAYCRLIEQTKGGKCPFGVILFGGTSNCVIIPNSLDRQKQTRLAIDDIHQWQGIQLLRPTLPPPPGGNQCAGCELGKPRRYRAGSSETVLNGKTLPACTASGEARSKEGSREKYHSDCGDRFEWVPRHDRAKELGIRE